MALSPKGMGEAVIRNLQNRTGKTLDQWVRVAKRSRLTDPKELRRWLKAEHGLGQTTCWIIADAVLSKPGGGPSDSSDDDNAELKHSIRKQNCQADKERPQLPGEDEAADVEELKK